MEIFGFLEKNGKNIHDQLQDVSKAQRSDARYE